MTNWTDWAKLIMYVLGFFVTPFIVYPWAKRERVEAPEWFAVVCGALWPLLAVFGVAYYPLKLFTRLIKRVGDKYDTR